MKRFYLLILCFLTISIAFSQKIPFQGRLLNDGKPFNGTADITFNIASPSWTETKNGVSVTDGYYSVVLGEATPIPDTLFRNAPEVILEITVNGEDLSPVTIYSPLPAFTGPQGIVVDTLKTFMAEALGVNDEGKARITSTNDGYDGIMSLTDSLGRTGNFMRTRKDGGYLQLVQQDFGDDSFKSAALMATFGDQNSYMDLYGENSTGDGIQLLVDVYGSNIDLEGPIPDGYRRGGIDIRNYYGALTHGIFSFQEGGVAKSIVSLSTSENGTNVRQTAELFSGDSISDASLNLTGKDLSNARLSINQDEGGSDPTGTAGILDLFGDQSVNAQIGANTFDDHDLGTINLYGSFDDGGGWWFNTAQLNSVRTPDASQEFGDFLLHNNTGGLSFNTVFLTGNFGETGAGGLELFDNAGQARVRITGDDANISANRTDGGSAANIFVASDNGGISIQNSADVNKLFYEAGSGILSLRDDGANNTIDLDGNLGNINATGDIAGTTLTSFDGSVQTSDKRLKKNIEDLENPLEHVSKLRGVSYQWKDETKSQKNQIGVIAQEVEAIYPEFVHTNDKGMKAVNYAQMTAVLIEAVKELNAKVEKLETENSSLKTSLSQIDQLRKELDALSKMLGGGKAASK